MISGIFGETGSGKTTLLKKIIEKLNKKKISYYLIDYAFSFPKKSNHIFPDTNNLDFILYEIFFEKTKKKYIIIDELAMFEYDTLFNKVLSLHRHLETNIIYATQSPVSILKTSRNIFRLTNRYYFCRYTNAENIKCFSFLSKIDIEKIRSLTPPNFVIF